MSEMAAPFLIVNERSGDGKARRVGIVAEARSRGFEVATLERGSDIRELATEAVERGARAVGVASGDGSLGPVADVAAEAGIPFICVPAGTRNHFARDLGLDRNDPVAALGALDGEERAVDIATAGSRVFLNNVSLGAYAQMVKDPEYRGKKLDVAGTVVPEILSGDRKPSELVFTGPAGGERDRALVVQISNNPFDVSQVSSLGERYRLDLGVLQISLLLPTSERKLRELVYQAMWGGLEKADGWSQWTTAAFRVDSPLERIDAGMDGEAVTFEPPVDFKIRPGALRMLVPPGTPPKRRQPTPLFSRRAVRGLWNILLGRGH